jgi:hypothetical protein
MKIKTFLLILLIPGGIYCQKNDTQNKKENNPIGLGLLGGINFANVTNASSINSSNQTGFMAGIFFSPPSKSVLGSKTELIYSRQGYNYATNTLTGTVNLDYILLPQMMTIRITKFIQLQVGMQIAFLINAKADSSSASSAGPYGSVIDYYNKFDYGATGGVEIHPFKGILAGARYNISFGNLYSNPAAYTGEQPSFIPTVNVKNNVLQLFAGYMF